MMAEVKTMSYPHNSDQAGQAAAAIAGAAAEERDTHDIARIYAQATQDQLGHL